MRISSFLRLTSNTLIFAIISTLTLTACSSSSDSELSSSTGAQSYNGPGSKWDVNLNADNTFTITMRENPDSSILLTVDGTYERLTSGFLKLTVATSTGDGGPTAGDEAWALEVPGYAFLLKPLDSGSDQIIPMVSAGNCPSEDFIANWVIVKKASSRAADDADADFFGEFSYTAASQSAIIPSARALENSFQDQGENSLGNGSCESGIMSIADAIMFLTSNGGAIVQTGVSDPDEGSFIFALTQKAISAVSNLDGDYAGMLFDENLSDGSKISPVSLACSNGTCTGTIVTNIETGATSTETVTVNLSGTPDDLGSGLITGTINDGTNSGNLACMADISVLDGDTKMINCIGQSPGDNTKMFNVLFISNT